MVTLLSKSIIKSLMVRKYYFFFFFFSNTSAVQWIQGILVNTTKPVHIARRATKSFSQTFSLLRFLHISLPLTCQVWRVIAVNPWPHSFNATHYAFSLRDSFAFLDNEKQHVTESIDVYIFQVFNSNSKSRAGATVRSHVQAISLFFFLNSRMCAELGNGMTRQKTVSPSDPRQRHLNLHNIKQERKLAIFEAHFLSP